MARLRSPGLMQRQMSLVASLTPAGDESNTAKSMAFAGAGEFRHGPAHLQMLLQHSNLIWLLPQSRVDSMSGSEGHGD